jgi:hypothetical protein
LARQIRVLSNEDQSDYGARRATYDLKKLRAKQIVRRIGQTRRYESTIISSNFTLKRLSKADFIRSQSRFYHTDLLGIFDMLSFLAS